MKIKDTRVKCYTLCTYTSYNTHCCSEVTFSQAQLNFIKGIAQNVVSNLEKKIVEQFHFRYRGYVS